MPTFNSDLKKTGLDRLGNIEQALGDVAAAAVASGALTPTTVKAANYTAAAGDFVPCDTTSGSLTITLPTAPTDGSHVGVKQITRGGTNTVTVATAGSDVFNKTGGSTSATLTLVGQAMTFQYQASLAVWYVVSDDEPLAQLDLRYPLAGTVTDASVASNAAIALSKLASGGLAVVASTTLSVDAASIDFSSIPQTYTRLWMLVRLRTDEAVQRSPVDIAFNGDSTAAHYANGRLYGIPGTAGTDGNNANRQVMFTVGDSGDASTFGSALILIGGYTDAKCKQALCVYGNVSQITSTVQYAAGLTITGSTITAAVTEITLTPSTGGSKFRAGSTATIYGIGV